MWSLQKNSRILHNLYSLCQIKTFSWSLTHYMIFVTLEYYAPQIKMFTYLGHLARMRLKRTNICSYVYFSFVFFVSVYILNDPQFLYPWLRRADLE